MTRLPTSSTTPIASLLNTSGAPVSFIYATHARWPLPRPAHPDRPHSAAESSARSPRLAITVLDSSFNPPHAAHVALAESALSVQRGRGRGHTARLLAFTVTNVDKDLDPRDLHHRLELIRALALDLESTKPEWDNVAVAVLDAATFVKKAQVLNDEIEGLLHHHHHDEVEAEIEPEFVFPVGWDTIVRIFAPRYYPPPGPDLASSMRTFLDSNRSSLVCARRGTQTRENKDEESRFSSEPEVAKWIERGKLSIVDLADEVREISSTSVRRAVQAGEWDRVNEMVPFPSVINVIKKEKLYLETK